MGRFAKIVFQKLTSCFKTKHLSPVNIYLFFFRTKLCLCEQSIDVKICLHAFNVTQYQMKPLNAALEFHVNVNRAV